MPNDISLVGIQEFLEHMGHSDEADVIIAKLNSAANAHSKNSLKCFLED